MTQTSQRGPYWIDTKSLGGSVEGPAFRMAIVPCPPGGERMAGYIESLQTEGVNMLVSLLQPEETRILGLEREGAVCREAGIVFKWMPVRDHFVPQSTEEFGMVVEEIRRELHAGKTVGAHCYAGIGRSVMLMACVLCAEGLSPEQSIARLSEARGMQVPDTWMQVQWVKHFAESVKKDSGQVL